MNLLKNTVSSRGFVHQEIFAPKCAAWCAATIAPQTKMPGDLSPGILFA
ncbi:MAG: hypothetical protein V4517_15990 [Pseudomonadota bacterium]